MFCGNGLKIIVSFIFLRFWSSFKCMTRILKKQVWEESVDLIILFHFTFLQRVGRGDCGYISKPSFHEESEWPTWWWHVSVCVIEYSQEQVAPGLWEEMWLWGHCSSGLWFTDIYLSETQRSVPAALPLCISSRMGFCRVCRLVLVGYTISPSSSSWKSSVTRKSNLFMSFSIF